MVHRCLLGMSGDRAVAGLCDSLFWLIALSVVLEGCVVEKLGRLLSRTGWSWVSLEMGMKQGVVAGVLRI